MDTKPIIPDSGKISVYLPREDWDYILENYETISKSDSALPWGKFFMAAMVAAMATRKPDSNPDDKKRIQELVGKVDELTNANNMLVGNNKQLQEELASFITPEFAHEIQVKAEMLEKSNDDYILEVARLQGELLTSRLNNVIPEGAIIVILQPGEKKVIDATALAETERTGSEVTPGLLMKNVFFFVLTHGPHDMFKAPVSISKIRELMAAAEMNKA